MEIVFVWNGDDRHPVNQAPDGNRASYWSQFPESEAEFLSHVRNPGIRASVDLEFSPETNVKSEYGGMSSAKLRRLVRRVREGHDLPEDLDREALRAFEADQEAWNEEYRVAVDRAKEKLPPPVFGCRWVRDHGGLIATRRAGGRSVPARLSFRLWRDDLGYMPMSE